MFEEYSKKLEAIGEDAPKVFELVAKKGAVFARNEAVNRTDKERLVDTGNYKRGWNAEKIEPQENVYGVRLENNVEYASYLEDGHKLRNGKRWKGRKVGAMSLQEARYYCIQQLDKLFEKLYAKYQRSFNKPD